MKIDLTCPAELCCYELPEEAGKPCRFELRNLGDKVMTSVQVLLHCYGKDGEMLFEQTNRVPDLYAMPGQTFSITIEPLEWNGVESIDLLIEKAWFEDHMVWRKGGAFLTEYSPRFLKPGLALDELRFVAGEDAVTYPQKQENVWICVCGRPNALTSNRCCRCGREIETVFRQYTPQAVRETNRLREQTLKQNTKKVLEKNSARQEERIKKEKADHRRKKKRIRAMIGMGVVLLLCAAAYAWGLPYVQYHIANQWVAEKRFDEAEALYQKASERIDIKEALCECRYLKAQSLLEDGAADSLLQAESLWIALSDYSDSADRAKEASYQLAERLLSEGSYEEATQRYQDLGEYADSPEKRKQAVYLQAEKLYGNANYAVARVLYLSLGSYRSAEDRAQDCGYEIALALVRNNRWQAALDECALLDEDDERVKALVKESNYALAQEAEEAGELEKAGSLYLKADDYEDALERADGCLYQLGIQAREAGEYDKAIALFLQIPAYEDSEQQARGCVYDQAMERMIVDDWAQAAALLTTVTNYSDAGEKLDECYFMMAQAALDEGDYARAEELLDQVIVHDKKLTLLRKLRYQMAETDFANEEYAAALQRYEKLGSYKDSATKAKRCHYMLAKSALESLDFDTAIAHLTVLGSYKDSKALLEDARYQRAQGLLDAGQTEAAREAFEAIGSKEGRAAAVRIAMDKADALFEDQAWEQAMLAYEQIDTAEAKEKRKLCAYRIAEKLEADGELEQAAEAFAALGSYLDSEERSKACLQSIRQGLMDMVNQAMTSMDYAKVIELLEEEADKEKPDAEFLELYREACYQLAEQLYRDARPYEAMLYYSRIGSYREADEKLKRGVYLIIGTWRGENGETAMFDTDGCCVINAENLYFQVSNVHLMTGTSEEELSYTHRLDEISEDAMTLTDLRSENVTTYHFERVKEESNE